MHRPVESGPVNQDRVRLKRARQRRRSRARNYLSSKRNNARRARWTVAFGHDRTLDPAPLPEAEETLGQTERVYADLRNRLEDLIAGRDMVDVSSAEDRHRISSISLSAWKKIRKSTARTKLSRTVRHQRLKSAAQGKSCEFAKQANALALSHFDLSRENIQTRIREIKALIRQIDRLRADMDS